jgi:hypothetical protein
VLAGLGDEGHSVESRAGVARGIRIAEDDVAELDPSDRPGARATSIASGASTMAGVKSRYSKMRANRAREVCRSSATRISPTSGWSRRACTVVKATTAPAVIAPVPPAMR